MNKIPWFIQEPNYSLLLIAASGLAFFWIGVAITYLTYTTIGE